MMLLTVLVSATAPATTCPLPAAWSTAIPAPRGGMQPMSNQVRFESGRLTWNGSAINDDQLALYLALTGQLQPQPRLLVDPAGMDCATLARIAAAVQRAGLTCADGLCVVMDIPDEMRPAPPSPPSPPRPR